MDIESRSKSKDFEVVINGETVSLHLKRPTQSELFEMDKVFRAVFAVALRQDPPIMTEAEARKLFEKTGAWTKIEEAKTNAYSLSIAQLELSLEEDIEDKNNNEKMEIIKKLSSLRADYLDLIGTKTSLFSHTAEGLANEQRMHKFVELCCMNVEEQFFADHDTYEIFVQDHADELADIHKQAYLFEYSLPEDITAEWKEVQLLGEMAKEEAEAAKKEKKAEEKSKVKKKRKKKVAITKG